MKTIRTILIAISTLAAMLAFASTSNAATTTVKLHTDADTTKFLSDSASGITTMAPTSSSNLQRWRRTDTTSGYAVYKNVETGRCLTGRGLQGFPVVTAQACVAGALNQQWRLNVTKDFVLRLNGVAMKHNLVGNGTGVVMALFNARNEMKWHTHAA